jgi:E3 ubiquitin-protein ligase RNF146
LLDSLLKESVSERQFKMAENSEKIGEVDTEDKDSERVSIECAVCLQNCIYPVQLPCKHIFCFLCVKGVTLQSKRCAMCRREIPQDYLFNPELLDQDREEDDEEDESSWFYEGRNGWWKYDQRTSAEIEQHQKAGAERCELLIAGFLYIIDFTHMLQYRRNDPSRRRGIKRDVATVPKKGVAGLRIGVDMDPQPGSSRQPNPAPSTLPGEEDGSDPGPDTQSTVNLSESQRSHDFVSDEEDHPGDQEEERGRTELRTRSNPGEVLERELSSNLEQLGISETTPSSTL